jgi:hypothetical protein
MMVRSLLVSFFVQPASGFRARGGTRRWWGKCNLGEGGGGCGSR